MSLTLLLSGSFTVLAEEEPEGTDSPAETEEAEKTPDTVLTEDSTGEEEIQKEENTETEETKEIQEEKEAQETEEVQNETETEEVQDEAETKEVQEETEIKSAPLKLRTMAAAQPEPLIKPVMNPAGQWVRSGSLWWFRYPDGSWPHEEWIETGNEKYYFDASGYMHTGWLMYKDHWFYTNSSGALVISSWIGNYYVKDDGSMAESEWVDNDKYFVGADGLWIPGYGVGVWKKDNTGWWYSDGYGGYPAGTFQEIDGLTYYFDAKGYMKTGWQLIKKYWYYFSGSGDMQTEKWIDGYYYVKKDGKMAVEEWVDKKQYYVGKDGRWIPGYGVGVWKKDSTGWWYDDGMGGYPKDVIQEIDNEKYMFNKKGYMLTGWQEYKKDWYYFKDSGAMAVSQWIGTEYYVKEDGKRATEESVTIDGKDYYFGADGKYLQYYGQKKWFYDANGYWYSRGDGTYPVNEWANIDGKWYHFDSRGYMQTGWIKVDGNWYYLGDDGARVYGWQSIDGYWYYFKEDGSMASAEYVDGSYWVGADGRWIEGYGNSLVVASGVSAANVVMRGIDISKWQGNIDLSGYADGFVIIRVSWGTNLDDMALRNMRLCEQLGIPYGVYCYSYALSNEDAAKEADFLLKIIKGHNISCGVWFDMEDADGYKNRNNVPATSPLISTMCQTFCKKVSDAGYHTGIYASYSWFGNYIKGCDNYDVWVAHWGINDGEMNSNMSYMSSIHQYTSRPLDKNVMYVPLEHFQGQ